MSGNDFLEKAHNKVLAEAEQLRAEVNRLRADLTEAHKTNSHLRRQLSAMTEVAQSFGDQDEVFDRFIAAVREDQDSGTGNGPLAPIILADNDRLQADVARWQATAEAEQLRAQAAEVERDRLLDRHIVRDGYGRYWITNASNYIVTGNNMRMFLGGPFSDRAGAVATVLEMAGLPIRSDTPELAESPDA
jgi:thioesterase domain-containing protein